MSRAVERVILALALVGCVAEVGPGDAATDLDAGTDAPPAPPPRDAGRDVGADAGVEPLDAPPDAFVDPDAGPCGPGDWVLEGSIVSRGQVQLRYPSTTGWLEIWPDASGALAVHRVAADLESIELAHALPEAHVTMAGVDYDAESTDAVNVTGGERLLLYWPTRRDHFLVRVVALDGTPRGDFHRVAASGWPAAAWTGSGYSMLVHGLDSSGLTFAYRVELATDGAVTRIRREDRAGTRALTYDEGIWRGILDGFGPAGPVVAVGLDTTFVEATPIGGGNVALLAAVLSPPRHAYFIVGGAWFLGGPPFLARLDVHGAIEAMLVLADRTGSIALATEDERTVAALYNQPGETWFVRVVDDVVVQRLRLPGVTGLRDPLLRWLGDRYAVGWGDSLDELVLCREP